MALSGSLQDFSVADIFSFLGQQNKTGLLNINRDAQKASLEMSAGAITRININEDTPEGMVKNILIRTNRIDEKLYQELNLLAGRAGKDIRELLVSKNYLSEAENNSWYHIAMEDMLLSLFFWKQGDYHFESRRHPTLKGGDIASLSIDYLTLEGVRQVDEWPDVIRNFPDEDMVFKVNMPDFKEYELGEGVFLMERMDGRKNLSQLKKEVPFGAYRFFSYLKKLWEEEFIALEESKPAVRAPQVVLTKQKKNNLKVTGMLTGAVLLLMFSYLARIQYYPHLYKEETKLGIIRKQRAVHQLLISSSEFVLENDRWPANFREITNYSPEVKKIAPFLADTLKSGYPQKFMWKH